MPSLLTAITFLLTLSISTNLTYAAHAGFHVQFPWMTRSPSPKTRPEINQYNPFCGMFPFASSPAVAQADTDKGRSCTTPIDTRAAPVVSSRSLAIQGTS